MKEEHEPIMANALSIGLDYNRLGRIDPVEVVIIHHGGKRYVANAEEIIGALVSSGLFKVVGDR